VPRSQLRMCGSLLPCLYTVADVKSKHQDSVLQQFVSDSFLIVTIKLNLIMEILKTHMRNVIL
jgi:hypothetical protein